VRAEISILPAAPQWLRVRGGMVRERHGVLPIMISFPDAAAARTSARSVVCRRFPKAGHALAASMHDSDGFCTRRSAGTEAIRPVGSV
jgi:hypothetical protein